METIALSYGEKRQTGFKKLKTALKKDAPFGIGSGALVWQSLFFYAPLVLMLISSFSRFHIDGSFEGFTLSHFAQILKLDYFKVIFKSLELGFTTACITLLLGFPLAYTIALKGGRFKTFLLFLVIIPFWTNFLLHIYAWFFVLEKGGFLNQLLLWLGLIQEPIHFLNTSFAVHLMMVYYYLPFMTLPIYSSLEKFDPTLIEASMDLGATKIQTFRRVVLPVLMPAIRTGFFLVFIPAFGEFVIPELMGGDKFMFVGSVVSQFILGEKTAPIGIAFTVLSGTILLFASFLLYKGTFALTKWLTGGQK
ncbi:MAG: ABC transporter permease [Verrucomicrobia bacterium]|nr:ABC transporter permease [Verrucomicrobiota bacterium]NDE63452.1 ABC transporter permease [Chlamydiota bacterium]